MLYLDGYKKYNIWYNKKYNRDGLNFRADNLTTCLNG